MSETLDIGGISIDLGGDNTTLKKKLTEVQKLFTDLQSKGGAAFDGLNLRGIAAAVGITAAVYKMLDAFNETIQAADELGKSAQKLGVGADQLSKLKAAADKADISFDELSTSLRVLTIQMQQASQGGDASHAFDALGISVKNADGTMKDSITVLEEVADQLSKYRDGANKTAIAIQLLGRQGQNMIPFLNQGRDAIQQTGEAAARAGQTIDQDLIDQSTKFNDVWKDISNILQGGVNQILKNILPGLNEIGQQFVDLAQKGSVFNETVKVITTTLQVMITVIETISIGLQSVGIMFASAMNAVYSSAQGDLKGAYVELVQGAQLVKSDYEDLGKTLSKVWGTDLPEAIVKGKAALDSVSGVTSVPSFGGKAFSDAVQSNNKPDAPHVASADEIARQLVTIQQNSQSLTQELTQMQAVLGITSTNINQNSAAWQQYDTAAQAAAQQLQALQQIDLSNILNDEGVVTYTEKWNALNAAVLKGAITLQQYDQMNKQLHDSQVANLEDLASQTAQTLTDIFGQNKLAAIASAIINTAVGVTKALSSAPPPYNFAMAALVAASGAAQLATIRSTTQSGGGSISSSGTGSGAAAAAATPVVPAAPTQTLEVLGLNPNSLFTGGAVRGIVQQLIDYQRDGGTVVLGK